MNPFLSQLNPHPHPLLSSFISLYILILLLFPSSFLNLLFSPILISSTLLLLSLLRLGASQNAARVTDNEPGSTISDPDPNRAGSFIEWDVGAPLEVIHEACCEGEEIDGDSSNDAVSAKTNFLGNRSFGSSVLQRYPSLSRYYPETDSDSDSDSDSSSSMDGGFPEGVGFCWEGEEIDGEKEGLIEIELDGDCGKRKGLRDSEFQIEEDNFIEIDISPASAGGER